MARPAALQFLKKGSLLVGKVFPRFVATWNWLVNAFDSMVGDGDLNPQSGYITIDRTNQDRPVIRFDGSRVNSGDTWRFGRFALREDGAAGFRFVDRYYSIGGKTFQIVSDIHVKKNTEHIIALSVDIRGQAPEASLESFGSFGEMVQAQENLNKYVTPLYTIKNGRVVLDWRVGPDASMGEFA